MKRRRRGNTKISNSNKLLFVCVTTILMISDAASRLRRRLCRRFEGKALIIIILLIAEKRFPASNFLFSMRCKTKLHHKRAVVYAFTEKPSNSRDYIMSDYCFMTGRDYTQTLKKLLLRAHQFNGGLPRTHRKRSLGSQQKSAH